MAAAIRRHGGKESSIADDGYPLDEIGPSAQNRSDNHAPTVRWTMTPTQFRRARTRLGMSCAQLAAELCCSRISIWRKEAGKQKITAADEKILRYLQNAPVLSNT